jgi:hypothetical protein
MMHTLRIAKRAGKVRGGVSQKRDVRHGPPFIQISQARSGILIQISRTLWASKLECDAHICLNLGFTSQNFRLSQVSLRVCYSRLSSFRMGEGNHLPSEQANWWCTATYRTENWAEYRRLQERT